MGRSRTIAPYAKHINRTVIGHILDQLIIGITDADSLAGESVLKALFNIDIAKEDIVLFSSTEAAGNRLAYGGQYIETQDQNKATFEECGILFQLKQNDEINEAMVNSGAIVIRQGGDLCFLNEQDDYAHQLDYAQNVYDLVDTEAYVILKALNAIQSCHEITGIQATILQSASHLEKAGVDELAKQTIDLLNARSVEPSVFPAQQAFNVIPSRQTATNGHLLSEQIKSNLQSAPQSVQVQTVAVPVFYGTTYLITVQSDDFLSQSQLMSDWAELVATQIVTDEKQLVSPVTSLQDDALASISHIQFDEESGKSVQFVITADDFRHGMAELFLNAMLVIRKTFL